MTQPVSGAGGAPSTPYVDPPGTEGAPGAPNTPPSTSGVEPMDIVLECLPELGKGALLTLVTSEVPAIAAATAFLTFYDATQCVTQSTEKAREAAAIRSAIEDCTQKGGIPATAGGVTNCIDSGSKR